MDVFRLVVTVVVMAGVVVAILMFERRRADGIARDTRRMAQAAPPKATTRTTRRRRPASAPACARLIARAGGPITGWVSGCGAVRVVGVGWWSGLAAWSGGERVGGDLAPGGQGPVVGPVGQSSVGEVSEGLGPVVAPAQRRQPVGEGLARGPALVGAEVGLDVVEVAGLRAPTASGVDAGGVTEPHRRRHPCGRVVSIGRRDGGVVDDGSDGDLPGREEPRPAGGPSAPGRASGTPPHPHSPARRWCRGGRGR